MDYTKQIRLTKQIEEGLEYFKAEGKDTVRTWNAGVDCFTFTTEKKTTVIKVTEKFVSVEQITDRNADAHWWVKFPIEIVEMVFIGGSFGMVEGADDTCFSNFYF